MVAGRLFYDIYTVKSDTWDDIKVFDKKGGRSGESLVSVRENGVVIISAAATRDMALRENRSKYAILAYSAKNRAVLLQFHPNEAPNTVKLMYGKTSVSFAGKLFFQSNSVDIKSIKGKYRPKMIEIPNFGPCWAIFLGEEIGGALGFFQDIAGKSRGGKKYGL